ncbi:MAG: TMEM175 family protein [Bacteroidota bacterium]
MSNANSNQKSLDRLISFSDAVFGFAITLLIMDILSIPHPKSGEPFFEVFVSHWQALVSFTVGFFTILVCWINHHHMFENIDKFNHRLIWINGLLLLIITFTPLPTSILAEYLDKENHIGVIFFGFTYFLIASLYYGIWAYAHNNHLLNGDGDPEYYYCIKLTYRLASIYTFITFFVCFLSNAVAISMYALMFAVFAFPHEFARILMNLRAKRINQS